MKKFVFTLFFLVIYGFSTIAQSNFDKGFKAGFEKGYCYTSSNPAQSYGICVPPLAPLPPLPQINESSDNYQDGYNRGFLYGLSRRREEENKSSSERSVSPDPPKFNPYVPQNPIIRLTPDERSAYYAARARQDQATAEAIAYLLDHIFTSTPEGKIRRADARIKREDNRLERKDDFRKIKENRANQFFEGSPSYNKCKKSKNIWLSSAFITGAAGTFSYLKANDYKSRYQNATNDAASIAKKGDVFYTIAPICFSAAGLCAFEFLMKSKKISKAKTQPVSFYPQISPRGAGLCIKLNF